VLAGAAGCGQPSEPQGPVMLGGVEVPIATIERGAFAYGRYCRRCHGPTGQGDGPHGLGLTVRPRDLTRGPYTLSTQSGGARLPSDDELVSFMSRGAPANGMPAFDLDSQTMNAVVQYTKSLNARWRTAPE
jgi:mono/diheme cytochrome c family protein